MREAVLVAVMSVVTILLRFLPFLVLRKETPPYIAYLGRVLPPAIIGDYRNAGDLLSEGRESHSVTSWYSGTDFSCLCYCLTGSETEYSGQYPGRHDSLHGPGPGGLLGEGKGFLIHSLV